MIRALLALCLTLWPLAAWPAAGLIVTASGVMGSHSDTMVVSDHPHHTILAEARILRHGSVAAFLVEIGHRRDGVHPPLRLDTALVAGGGAEYHPASRVERFCRGSGGCPGWRVGAIFLHPAAFDRAAEEGLVLRLLGPDGALDLALPPSLFAEALAGADRLR